MLFRYVRMKQKAAASVGMEVDVHRFESNVTEEEVLKKGVPLTFNKVSSHCVCIHSYAFAYIHTLSMFFLISPQ